MSSIDRRDFMKTSAAVAAAATAMAGTSRAANDVIRVGVAGVKGRGTAHISGFEGLENVEVVAMCDVDKQVLKDRSAGHAKRTGRDIKQYVDVRKMIDDKDIDVISIATPNHWHALIGVWAMRAGKDVYVEKPCSHNVFEGRQLVETARNYKQICQHGTQSRSSEAVREAIDLIQDGGIGKVHTAKGLCYKWRPSITNDSRRLKLNSGESLESRLDWNLWQGPAQTREFDNRYVHYNWHWSWDFGNGDIGNQGVHQMDVARWGLGKNSLPVKVESAGGRFGYKDDGQTPNTQLSVLEYDDGSILQFEVRGLPTNDEKGVNVGNIFYGSEGYLVLRGSSWETFFGRNNEPGKKNTKGGGNHFANFITAVRSRNPEDLHAEINEGHLSSALCHLANVAFRTGRKLEFDPNSETFGNDAEANKLLTRDYRAPFTFPTG